MRRDTVTSPYLPYFLAAVREETGADVLAGVLAKAGLPTPWALPTAASALGGEQALQAFIGVQVAIHTYYGRGARGTLARAGRRMWDCLLAGAPWYQSARLGLVRALPRRARPAAALGALTSLLGARRKEITIRGHGAHLSLTGHALPTLPVGSASEPSCALTAGLVGACLEWATGKPPEVVETRCRACGDPACAFEITYGG